MNRLYQQFAELISLDPGTTNKILVSLAVVVPFINVVRLALLALTYLTLHHIFHAISHPIRRHPILLRRFYGAIWPLGPSILAGMEFL